MKTLVNQKGTIIISRLTERKGWRTTTGFDN